jgi:hypothetical protein
MPPTLPTQPSTPEAPPPAPPVEYHFAYALEVFVTQRRLAPNGAEVATSSKRLVTGDARAILEALPGLRDLHGKLATPGAP